MSVAAVVLLVLALIAGLTTVVYFDNRESVAAFERHAVLGLLATGMLLAYFDLRGRALSPALAEARLQALQARIRPHFLYNSINAVLSLMAKISTGYWTLFDPTNGYTAIDARVASWLRFESLNERYFFETDMLFRLNTLRAVVIDVPAAIAWRTAR